MPNRNIPILKAVVCVAWADGLLKEPERRALDGVTAACGLTPEEAAEVRTYAAMPHTLRDLDIRGLADYSAPERQTIQGLCERRGLSPEETHKPMVTANLRQSHR
jgi:hypothetical protein